MHKAYGGNLITKDCRLHVADLVKRVPNVDRANWFAQLLISHRSGKHLKMPAWICTSIKQLRLSYAQLCGVTGWFKLLTRGLTFMMANIFTYFLFVIFPESEVEICCSTTAFYSILNVVLYVDSVALQSCLLCMHTVFMTSPGVNLWRDTMSSHRDV